MNRNAKVLKAFQDTVEALSFMDTASPYLKWRLVGCERDGEIVYFFAPDYEKDSFSAYRFETFFKSKLGRPASVVYVEHDGHDDEISPDAGGGERDSPELEPSFLNINVLPGLLDPRPFIKHVENLAALREKRRAERLAQAAAAAQRKPSFSPSLSPVEAAVQRFRKWADESEACRARIVDAAFKAACEIYDADLDSILGNRRFDNLTGARRVLAYFFRVGMNFSFDKIAKILKREHCTIIKFCEIAKKNDPMESNYKKLVMKINESLSFLALDTK